MQAELTAVSFAPASFDAAVAYSAIALWPHGRRDGLFGAIAGWPRPGGVLALCLGVGVSAGVEDDRLGVPARVSHFGAEVNLALRRDARFAILHAGAAKTIEGGATVPFPRVVAATAGCPGSSWERPARGPSVTTHGTEPPGASARSSG